MVQGGSGHELNDPRVAQSIEKQRELHTIFQKRPSMSDALRVKAEELTELIEPIGYSYADAVKLVTDFATQPEQLEEAVSAMMDDSRLKPEEWVSTNKPRKERRPPRQRRDRQQGKRPNQRKTFPRSDEDPITTTTTAGDVPARPPQTPPIAIAATEPPATAPAKGNTPLPTAETIASRPTTASQDRSSWAQRMRTKSKTALPLVEPTQPEREEPLAPPRALPASPTPPPLQKPVEEKPRFADAELPRSRPNRDSSWSSELRNHEIPRAPEQPPRAPDALRTLEPPRVLEPSRIPEPSRVLEPPRALELPRSLEPLGLRQGLEQARVMDHPRAVEASRRSERPQRSIDKSRDQLNGDRNRIAEVGMRFGGDLLPADRLRAIDRSKESDVPKARIEFRNEPRSEQPPLGAVTIPPSATAFHQRPSASGMPNVTLPEHYLPKSLASNFTFGSLRWPARETSEERSVMSSQPKYVSQTFGPHSMQSDYYPRPSYDGLRRTNSPQQTPTDIQWNYDGYSMQPTMYPPERKPPMKIWQPKDHQEPKPLCYPPGMTYSAAPATRTPMGPFGSVAVDRRSVAAPPAYMPAAAYGPSYASYTEAVPDQLISHEQAVSEYNQLKQTQWQKEGATKTDSRYARWTREGLTHAPARSTDVYSQAMPSPYGYPGSTPPGLAPYAY